MTPLDTALAVAGRVAHVVEQRTGGSRRRSWWIVAGLITVSAIPIAFVGSSPRPTDLSFDDVRHERIPAMTTWVRLEGELRTTDPAGSLYELHDPRDDTTYLIVIAEAPLSTGHTLVTGRISPTGGATGNVGTIAADVPAVPRVDEPIWLYLTPGVIGIVIGIGLSAGYPVVRRERRSRDRGEPLDPGASIASSWSGRIAGTSVAGVAPLPCTVSVSATPDAPDLIEVSIADVHATHHLRIRARGPVQAVRSCRITRCEPGIEIHSHSADLVLTFADAAHRDRLAATLRLSRLMEPGGASGGT
jgi:hypothetical protein